MDAVIKKAELHGSVLVCASKSEAHRLLLCAFLSFAETQILLGEGVLPEDLLATAGCLAALGADVRTENGSILVDSAACRTADRFSSQTVLDCGESGSTLRFMLPVAGALGGTYRFVGRGRLPERPNRPLLAAMAAGGMRFDREDGLPLGAAGTLQAGEYVLPGNISSQYISGLLFALPLLGGDSTVRITGRIESLPYISMTLDALARFGVRTEARLGEEQNGDPEAGGTVLVPGRQRYRSPGRVSVNGDWSNGAFWLCAGAIGQNRIECRNLAAQTEQGDARITEIIRLIRGAEDGAEITVDASQTPDLVPVTAVLACSRHGKTVLCGAERLRIKESDRIRTTVAMIRALGGSAGETDGGLTVFGTGSLCGGTVDSCGDHRIAMSAAVAASLCREPVRILNAQAVAKSYPDFFDVYERLGGVVERS